MKRIFDLISKYLVPTEFPPSELKASNLNVELSPNLSKTQRKEGNELVDNNDKELTEYNSHCEKEIFARPVQEIKPYFILMLKPNCDLLLSKFMREISTLRLSDARGVDFSFDKSLQRLRIGYTVTLFNYNSGVPIKAFISIDGYGIMIKTSKYLEHHFSYESVKATLLGPLSSTFQQYFLKGGRLKHLALEETDCFSILGEFQNFDFATHSDTAKYDILQVVSFYISSRARNSFPILPYKHSSMAIFKVRQKIKEMAEKRFMTVKELLIVILIQLAILKSLVINDAPSNMLERAKFLLNQSFSASSKLYRVSVMMRPSEFKSSVIFNKKYKDTLRKLILSKRKRCRVFDSIHGAVKTLAAEDSKKQGKMRTRVLLMNKKKEEWGRIKGFFENIA